MTVMAYCCYRFADGTCDGAPDTACSKPAIREFASLAFEDVCRICMRSRRKMNFRSAPNGTMDGKDHGAG